MWRPGSSCDRRRSATATSVGASALYLEQGELAPTDLVEKIVARTLQDPGAPAAWTSPPFSAELGWFPLYIYGMEYGTGIDFGLD